MKKPSIDKALWVYFDKPERMRALYQLRNHVSQKDFIRAFGEVWVNLESHYSDMEIVKKIIAYINLPREVMRDILMDENERKEWIKISRDLTIKIYRGCWKGNMHGWSWTLDPVIAGRFAQRHAPDGFPLVVEGVVKCSDVIAYFNRRDEQEIVIEPEKILNRQILSLPYKEPTVNGMIYQAVQAGNLYTPEQKREVAIMQASLDPKRYVDYSRDRLRFFKKYGFLKHYRELKEVVDYVSAKGQKNEA